MKSYARSIRIAPKKANIVAKMVRGLSVNEALNQLGRTHKKAARIIEDLVASAAANAEHNDKQNRALLVVKTIVVNQAAGYDRGVPMARGRMRPMKKFMSHIAVTLGIAEGAEPKSAKKAPKAASQSAKKPVQKSNPTKVSKDSSPEAPSSSESSISSIASDSSK